MKEPRFIKSSTPEENCKTLSVLYKDGWELICIHEGVIYIHRDIKKQSTALVVQNESKTMQSLLHFSELSKEAVTFAETNSIDQERLQEFGLYWLEKGENDRKHRFEKQKSFDVKLRLANWLKREKKGSTGSKISSTQF